MALRQAFGALLLCAAVPASAQLGAATQSPPPEGVAAVVQGDLMVGSVAGLGQLKIRVD